MQIEKLAPFGVEIQGFKARDATEDQFCAFEQAVHAHSLVLIRDPGLTPAGHVALMARLGPVVAELAGGSSLSYVLNDPGHADTPEFGRGALSFHFDLAFTDDWPFHLMSLYGEEVAAIGGETGFAHGGCGFAHLSDADKAAVAGRRAVHVYDPYLPTSTPKFREDGLGRYAERGIHDIVRAHPYTNEPVITAAYMTTDRIVGASRLDGDRLIQALFAALYAPVATYTHRWRVGDLLIWDNRVVQHARSDFDSAQRRKLRRVIVGDEASIQARFRRWFEQVPTP